MVVRASAEESRRAVLGGLLAGVAALTASTANAAVYNDFVDDRKAKANGFDIVYEARELDLPQAVRDGLAQVRRGLAERVELWQLQRVVGGSYGGLRRSTGRAGQGGGRSDGSVLAWVLS